MSLNGSYRFRVRAMDRASNLSGFMTGPTVLPKLYQESTSLATYAGTWSTAASTAASGGHTRYATRAGASVSSGSRAGRRGRRAEGLPAAAASRSTSMASYVGTDQPVSGSSTVAGGAVRHGTGATCGSHKVKLVSVGTSGHPRFDIDAFAVSCSSAAAQLPR